MKSIFAKFARDESGAITVDWVVLCAAVVGLAATATLAIQTSTDGLAQNTGTYINSQDFF
jgi:Flp pilus assembly pilin Flp